MVEVAVVGCTLDHRIAVRKLLCDVVRSACSYLGHPEGGNLRQIPLIIWYYVSSFFAVVRVIVLLTNGCSHHGVLGSR